MLPHERALVERLKNKPFALIGINTDAPETFKERAPKEGVSWRNILEGRTGGALVRGWGVQSFPTIYVLDATGKVRYTNVRGEQMDAAVDALLGELERAQKPQGKPPEKP
jgi:hypothetical protein